LGHITPIQVSFSTTKSNPNPDLEIGEWVRRGHCGKFFNRAFLFSKFLFRCHG
jgi:hypothetical protein